MDKQAIDTGGSIMYVVNPRKVVIQKPTEHNSHTEVPRPDKILFILVVLGSLFENGEERYRKEGSLSLSSSLWGFSSHIFSES